MSNTNQLNMSYEDYKNDDNDCNTEKENDSMLLGDVKEYLFKKYIQDKQFGGYIHKEPVYNGDIITDIDTNKVQIGYDGVFYITRDGVNYSNDIIQLICSTKNRYLCTSTGKYIPHLLRNSLLCEEHFLISDIQEKYNVINYGMDIGIDFIHKQYLCFTYKVEYDDDFIYPSILICNGNFIEYKSETVADRMRTNPLIAHITKRVDDLVFLDLDEVVAPTAKLRIYPTIIKFYDETKTIRVCNVTVAELMDLFYYGLKTNFLVNVIDHNGERIIFSIKGTHYPYLTICQLLNAFST